MSSKLLGSELLKRDTYTLLNNSYGKWIDDLKKRYNNFVMIEKQKYFSHEDKEWVATVSFTYEDKK